MLIFDCTKKHAGVQKRTRHGEILHTTHRIPTPHQPIDWDQDLSSPSFACLHGLSSELINVVRFHGQPRQVRCVLPRVTVNPSRNLSCHCPRSLQAHRPRGRLKTPQSSAIMIFPMLHSYACQQINPCPAITQIGIFSCSANLLASMRANRNYQGNPLSEGRVPRMRFAVSGILAWHPSPSTPPSEHPSPSPTSSNKDMHKSGHRGLNNGCWVGRFFVQLAYDTHK